MSEYLRWVGWQFYLLLFWPTRFGRKVEGLRGLGAQLNAKQRIACMMKLLPWLAPLAVLGTALVGQATDLYGRGYGWGECWFGVGVGIGVGIGVAAALAVTLGVRFGIRASVWAGIWVGAAYGVASRGAFDVRVGLWAGVPTGVILALAKTSTDVRGIVRSARDFAGVARSVVRGIAVAVLPSVVTGLVTGIAVGVAFGVAFSLLIRSSGVGFYWVGVGLAVMTAFGYGSWLGVWVGVSHGVAVGVAGTPSALTRLPAENGCQP